MKLITILFVAQAFIEPAFATQLSKEAVIDKVKIQHNTKEDDAYLTKVFGKFSVLGLDSEDVPNGKRVLTKFNALNVAHEVCGRWLGLRGKDLD